ncbi:MAG: hypothetical protein AB1480_01035 [Nitrospirota bacterium]
MFLIFAVTVIASPIAEVGLEKAISERLGANSSATASREIEKYGHIPFS